MSNNVPITNGQGQSSVAAEEISTVKYQQIKVVDGTTSSTNKWVINSDGSAQVSILGGITISGGSVAAVISNASVSGTVGASVLGWVPIQPSNTSIITRWADSSVIAVATGSMIAIPTGNQSVSGTTGASIIGWAPIQPSNTSIITRWADSSVIAIVTGSVATINSGNQSVSGTVGASVIGLTPVAVTGGGTVVNAVAWSADNVGNGTQGLGDSSAIFVFNGSNYDRLRGNSSIGALVNLGTGSVITVSTGSIITVWKDSSVLAVPVGSTIAVLQAASVVGTYAEDAAHTPGDKGLFSLGVRNDTLASVTSATGDYSQVSTGPSGEVVTANAPITKWVRGTADLRVVLGSSVTAIAAQGASVFTYVTSAQVANFGSASVIVTFAGGLGSILGYTIAPAGGGSNIYYPNALKTGENSAFTASISGTASVLVSVQGFTAGV